MSQRVVPRLLLALAAIALTGTVALARPRPNRGRRFEANKTFGLGLMIGAPTGLSGKYFLAPDRAIDFGVGAIGYYNGRDGLHLHADYLWHPVSLVSADAFELPFYVGIGARLFDFGCNGCKDNVAALGARVPFGIAFDFNNVPIDVFLELAVVVDVFVNDYPGHDRLGADLNGAVGFRYYFN
jgi:hypothetical protein